MLQLYCRTEQSVGVPSYRTHMRLTIYNVQHSDYGTVKCVGMILFPQIIKVLKVFTKYKFFLISIAKNPRGETDGTIRLYRKSNIKIFFFMFS